MSRPNHSRDMVMSSDLKMRVQVLLGCKGSWRGKSMRMALSIGRTKNVTDNTPLSKTYLRHRYTSCYNNGFLDIASLPQLY